jgi:predicted TIM-barrel fold metal-dependent hydrolase
MAELKAEAPAKSNMVTHALINHSPGSGTLCGKKGGRLPVGDCAIGTPVEDREWITCPACRDQLKTRSLSIEDYKPKSTLVVPEHHPRRARYPFIDVHSHQDPFMSQEKLGQLVKDMDSLNLQILVNLSGGFGNTLKSGVQNMQERYPQRFITFANIDFSGINDRDYSRRVAHQFEEDVRNGAQGLKIYGNFGTDFKDSNGKRIAVDDARFDELFENCARLKVPVLIHTADPKPFFDPVDCYNERWLELRTVPTRQRPPDRYPAWQSLIDEQHRLFARHPGTIFINAHLGWLGSDLDELSRLLDRLPNVYTEIGAVLAELGRQPRQARQWFIKHQDRVLFGKDAWNPAEYHTYFRVLETADEYFDHYRSYQGFWKLYGLDLPEEVLRKLYYKNALQLLPGADAALFLQEEAAASGRSRSRALGE